MPAHDYCRDKVALPGSSLYYSLLYVAPELRASLTAVHAAAEELRELVDACSDQRVARAKLGWWAEEFERARAGQARHPVTQALGEPLARARVEPARLAGLLQALNEHLHRDRYRTLAEIESHFARMADLTGCMAAEFCGYRNPSTLTAARELGTGLALADLARRPQRRSAHRLTNMPDELLSDCGASDADFAGPDTGAALKAMVRRVTERARARLGDSLEGVPEEDRGAQRCRLVLAEMELAQLGALERADFAVLEGPVSVTPLRKLWIAWKHRL